MIVTPGAAVAEFIECGRQSGLGEVVASLVVGIGQKLIDVRRGHGEPVDAALHPVHRDGEQHEYGGDEQRGEPLHTDSKHNRPHEGETQSRAVTDLLSTDRTTCGDPARTDLEVWCAPLLCRSQAAPTVKGATVLGDGKPARDTSLNTVSPRTTTPVRSAARRRDETRLGLVRRARRMNRTLQIAFPHVYCELDFTTPLELSVATILSAQCTDVRVNQVTPALFAAYPDARAYAEADRTELEEMIRSTGFYRNKANSIIGLGQALVGRFGGEVPDNLADLVTLPGFGRKTANVVLGNAFGVPGITVDTHFGRLVRRWQWTAETDPVKVERVVGELIERKEWTDLSHRVIFHGRRVCHARKPACGVCILAKDCPSYGEGPVDKLAAAALVKGPETPHLLALAGIGDAVTEP